MTAQDVDVWWLTTDGFGSLDRLAVRAEQLMDGAERARCARLIEPARRQFRASRFLLRHSLSRYADRAPADWRFGREQWGRPVIEDAPDGLDFSASHTEGMVVVAVSRGLRCGVDVEPLRPRPGLMPLRHKVLAPDELAAMPADDGRSAALLARTWVLKEAYTKALGSGWQYGFGSFAIDWTDPLTLRDPAATGPWSLREMAVAEHRIGLAVPADPCTINLIDARDPTV